MHTRHPRTFGPRRTRRGAVMVEAVIVLPVFMILFISVLYVRRQAVARHHVDMQARSCAWLYSAGNCADVPPECAGFVRVASPAGQPRVEVMDALEGGADRAARGDMEGVVGQVVGALIGPTLGAAFGKSLASDVNAEVERPALYGGETRLVAGQYRLACNLEKRTAADVAMDAWEGLVR